MPRGAAALHSGRRSRSRPLFDAYSRGMINDCKSNACPSREEGLNLECATCVTARSGLERQGTTDLDQMWSPLLHLAIWFGLP